MKKLKKIKSNILSRQIGMAKLGLKAGSDYLFSKRGEFVDKVSDVLDKRSQEIVNELSTMKGSMMKAGQLLSMYGEYFFPPKANQILKSLQSQSYFLDWEVMKESVPKAWFEELEIEVEPLAAASIGQVHKAVIKESKEEIALKIQYPKVRDAINSDVKALKYLLKAIKVLPKKIDTEAIFDEVKEMLYQETDYIQEKAHHEKFQSLLAEDDRFATPKIYDKYSNQSILATELIKGYRIDEDRVQQLDQETKNSLGNAYLDLYFKEIFDWGVVQTDAHIGNYLIDFVEDRPRFVLIDFGASKKIPDDFKESYCYLIKYAVEAQKENYRKMLIKSGYLAHDIDDDLFDRLWVYAQNVVIPLQAKTYDYGGSKLPDLLVQQFSELIKELPFEKTPKDSLFLDRKLGGVFIILKVLGATVNGESIVQKYIKNL